MNSCLQCLSNTTLLTEYFISKQYVREINKTNPIGTKGKLTVKYAKMIQALWCKDSNSYSPSVLKNAIS
jgi:ubiquitin C-terminal hydrolase